MSSSSPAILRLAVISLGGVVISKSLRIAGDELDMEIVNYAKTKYNLLLGERTAEEIKINVGNVADVEKETENRAVFRGRDLRTGLPKAVEVSAYELREILRPPVYSVIETVKDALEETPAELISDIIKKRNFFGGR